MKTDNKTTMEESRLSPDEIEQGWEPFDFWLFIAQIGLTFVAASAAILIMSAMGRRYGFLAIPLTGIALAVIAGLIGYGYDYIRGWFMD